MRPTRALPALALTAILAIAACGGDDDTDLHGGSDGTPVPRAVVRTTAPPAISDEDLAYLTLKTLYEERGYTMNRSKFRTLTVEACSMMDDTDDFDSLLPSMALAAIDESSSERETMDMAYLLGATFTAAVHSECPEHRFEWESAGS